MDRLAKLETQIAEDKAKLAAHRKELDQLAAVFAAEDDRETLLCKRYNEAIVKGFTYADGQMTFGAELEHVVALRRSRTAERVAIEERYVAAQKRIDRAVKEREKLKAERETLADLKRKRSALDFEINKLEYFGASLEPLRFDKMVCDYYGMYPNTQAVW